MTKSRRELESADNDREEQDSGEHREPLPETTDEDGFPLENPSG
ncbi:hypothetical protein [Microbacterium sp. CnD16-F]|nr:hypothetical protein [Microbacterium sp. CnD16-F]